MVFISIYKNLGGGQALYKSKSKYSTAAMFYINNVWVNTGRPVMTSSTAICSRSSRGVGQKSNVQRCLNLYTTGPRTSGKEEVNHWLTMLALPIMLIVTELGFLRMQS